MLRARQDLSVTLTLHSLSGEDLPFHQHEIKVQIDANGDNVYLGWPITACHVIDESSPFYYLSEKNLSRAAFEIIVILEGIVESTGKLHCDTCSFYGVSSNVGNS